MTTAAPQGPRVLAIEDDIGTIEGLTSELELSYARIAYTDTGSEGESRIKSEAFDLLIVDMRLPWVKSEAVDEMAGLRLLAKLQRGELGELNKETLCVLASAQEFRVDILLERMSENGMAVPNMDGVLRFQKGDEIIPFAARLIELLS
ncbi:MAG TPA: hypothetical protein VG889_13835 [Rhizomicrobium sp.]|nr:hypothetical protein [Rhizomicrobium sp.]